MFISVTSISSVMWSLHLWSVCVYPVIPLCKHISVICILLVCLNWYPAYKNMYGYYPWSFSKINFCNFQSDVCFIILGNIRYPLVYVTVSRSLNWSINENFLIQYFLIKKSRLTVLKLFPSKCHCPNTHSRNNECYTSYSSSDDSQTPEVKTVSAHTIQTPSVSNGRDPLFLILRTRWGEWSVLHPGFFSSGIRTSGTHRIRGWEGPKTSLEICRKKVSYPCWESNAEGLTQVQDARVFIHNESCTVTW